ncbi:MAG: hypothetical protein Q8M29_16475 [Bacteroidota bacterium]|nr:hypothetical protein [Bacteroidota bacterium]
MKKSVLALAMAFGVTGAFAQDLTSKKGEPFLPEAGDWSIGVDATPFLEYTKTLIGTSNGVNSPNFNFLTGQNFITGKMFKDEKTAYRAALRLQMETNKYQNEVDEYVATAPSSTPTAGLSENTTKKVVDKAAVTNRMIGISAGMEMRRGKTRLQGYYGGEVAIWGSSKKEKYSYGNDLVQVTPTTTTADLDATTAGNSTDWSAMGPNETNVTTSLTGYTNVEAARLLKRKTNGQIGISVRGFIGAEYFIFPKISLAGEFGWGIGYSVSTKNKATWDAEGVDSGNGNENAAEIEIKQGVNNGSFVGFDTDNNNSAVGPVGSLRLNFHF